VFEDREKLYGAFQIVNFQCALPKSGSRLA